MSYCDKLRQRSVTSCDGLLRQKIGKRWRFHKDAIDEWVKRGPWTSTGESVNDAQ